MQSILCDSLLVQIATHEQRQSLTQFLGDLESSTHRVKPLPFAFYWRHRGFWRTTKSFLLHDGVHLNQRGQFKLYRSLRGALIQSLKVFNDVQS